MLEGLRAVLDAGKTGDLILDDGVGRFVHGGRFWKPVEGAAMPPGSRTVPPTASERRRKGSSLREVPLPTKSRRSRRGQHTESRSGDAWPVQACAR